MAQQNNVFKRVVFLQVDDNKKKISKIIQTATHHFECIENLLILVPNDKAKKYIDEILWTLPDDSFLPHSTDEKAEGEKIVVTTIKKNINQSSYLFNLCEDCQFFDPSFQIIYEFEDFSSAQKKDISNKKFKKYKDKDYLIESR